MLSNVQAKRRRMAQTPQVVSMKRRLAQLSELSRLLARNNALLGRLRNGVNLPYAVS
jgi:hypothetical protein